MEDTDIPTEGERNVTEIPASKLVPSVSEAATASSSGRQTPSSCLSWFEVPFRVKSLSNGSFLPEATGWAMDACARVPVNQAGALLGTAIVRLATKDAGCQRPATCDNTVYGLRPSSLLTTTSAAVGVSSALLMPVIGAVVDYTRYRKHVGVVSAAMTVTITAVQISVSQANWFYMLILEAVGGFVLLVHVAAVFAYLSDLTNVESDLVHYSSRFKLRQSLCQTLYLGTLLLVGKIRGPDNTIQSSVRGAREALGIAFGMSFPLFFYAWLFLFRKRKALSRVPEGHCLLSAGFAKVFRTSKTIHKKYNSLKWFMVSLLWSPEAGAGVVLSIATTFLVSYLEMSSQQVALTSLTLFGMHIPGSFVAKWVCGRFNPLNSYRAALLYYAVAIAAASASLTGPERRDWAYAFAAMWGFAMGWAYPSQRVLLCTLIPKGQEMEMMGLFTFTGQILGWLPPLLFTVLNERGVNMRWGLSINAFFITISLICLQCMGSYKSAMDQVRNERTTDVTVREATERERELQSERLGSTDTDRERQLQRDEHGSTD